MAEETDIEHGNVLLKCAQQLLQMCKYVDVALTVQEKRIFCHRLVLVSYSGYFDALFTNISLMPGATYDASLDDIGIKLSNFNVLLQFMYTGYIYPQGCNLEELLKTAEKLKIDRAAQLLQQLIDNKKKEGEEKDIVKTRESRRGKQKNVPGSAEKHPTKKKKHKKKQEKPKKIPKMSEEEVAELTKIKTEVLESESLLDPASGDIAEKMSKVPESERNDVNDDVTRSDDDAASVVKNPTDEAQPAETSILDEAWRALADAENVYDSGDSGNEDKTVGCDEDDEDNESDSMPNDKNITEEDKGAVKEEPQSDLDTVSQGNKENESDVKREVASDGQVAVKRKRGRPKGAVSKDKLKKVVKKRRKTELPRKLLRSGIVKRPRVPALSIRGYKKEDGVFHCDKCEFTSHVDKTFRLHIRRHTGEKPYMCNICGKGFIDSKYLGDHIRVHTGERPFACEVCAARFKAKKHLSRHMLTHVEARNYQCDRCPAAFKSPTQLREHIDRIHNKIRPHKCDFPGCKYAGFTPYDLKMHKEKHGMRDASQSILCDFCGKVFHRFGSLKAHLKLHSNKIERCLHCDFSSPYKQVVLHHCMRHHGVDLGNKPVERSLKCDLCDFAAFTKQEYDIHMYKHSGYRPHKCPICNFAAVDKGTITKHLRVHTGDLPFSCKTCGKQFTQQSGLARHKRIHLGIKPYQCTQCGKYYSDRKTLRVHMFTHDSVKPYICHICSQGYVRKDILANHISKKHGPEMVPLEMRPQQKPKPLQISKRKLEELLPNMTSTQTLPQAEAIQETSQQPLPQQQQPPQQQQQQQQVQSQHQDQQSQPNNVVSAIPLTSSMTSSVTSHNITRAFTTDLVTSEPTVAVDSIISQTGLELSTIDPSSHHQLLGHMPSVATASGHMGHMPASLEAHHPMTVGQPPHQSAAVISQLIHPNTYITGLTNGMSMPPHLSHAHPHYQM